MFTVGVGSAAGEILQVASDPNGNARFLYDAEGNVVKSRLNESALKEIAEAGGGFYLPLQNAQTMTTLYQRGLAPMPKTGTKGGRLRQAVERFQWPLGLAVGLLLWEILFPERAVRTNLLNAAGVSTLAIA